MKVLVVDIGGSHVKMLATGQQQYRRFDSGADFMPGQLVKSVQQHTADWTYDAMSIGYPGAVGQHGPVAEPGNLRAGWVRFDFEKAFDRPVRLVNDAAMQALGAYDGGRMLFLGLGTGVGSALVVDRVVIPLELGCLPFDGQTALFDRLSKAALEANGKTVWLSAIERAIGFLRESFVADYVVLGGGNAAIVDPLPPDVRRGGNDDAFTGGFRLWEEEVSLHEEGVRREWRVMC